MKTPSQLDRVAHCMDNFLWDENIRLGHSIFQLEMDKLAMENMLEDYESRIADYMTTIRELQIRLSRALHDRETLLVENMELDMIIQRYREDATTTDGSDDEPEPVRRRLIFE